MSLLGHFLILTKSQGGGGLPRLLGRKNRGNNAQSVRNKVPGLELQNQTVSVHAGGGVGA